ncbi:MAG: hypothetical protein GC150_12600 [Rhizobiales bacterium]|nr:hypothetical protein [Hyphomicrobiales bacterium]
MRRVIAYGLIVFAAGFCLGALRELALAPLFGAQAAHWIEFPLMLIAVWLIARWIFGETTEGHGPGRLAEGALAVLLLVVLESGLAILVLGLPLDVYLTSYDVRRGALFPFGLAFMALAPLLFGNRARRLP